MSCSTYNAFVSYLYWRVSKIYLLAFVLSRVCIGFIGNKRAQKAYSTESLSQQEKTEVVKEKSDDDNKEIF